MNIKYNISLILLLVFYNIGFSQTFKQYLNAGNNSFNKAEYYAAISYFEKASLFHKKSDEIHYKIGQSFLELKDYDNALRNFSKIKTKSQFPLLLYKMGNGFMLVGDYKQAIKYYKSFDNSYKENDFYSQNAKQQLSACYWVTDHLGVKDVKIENLDKTINSEFSEFSATYFKDSLIQVSSFFQDEEDKRNDYISDILFFEKVLNVYNRKEINIAKEKKLQLANGFYLQEKERFYFNQCEATKNGTKRCDLYVSEYKDKYWSKPIYLNINDKNFTSTQASVYINNEGKDVIYFVSDRIGGVGKKDIWKATETNLGFFENVEVLDKTINTMSDEASPFFDSNTNTLYFSSKWHYGYGGYDIFKSKVKNGNFSKPENIGLPYNSSANDLYFNINKDEKGMLSSNREGAMKLRGAACCYDIFKFEKDVKTIASRKDSISKIDSLIVVQKTDSSNTILDKIREMLPITVYFHNDEPHPKTTDTISTFSYSETYKAFLKLKDDYYKMNDFEEIDAFFYDDLQKGMKDLKAFEKLLKLLIPNNKIQLDIKGYCSPLAKNDYNINLSKRRISTLKNELALEKDLKNAVSNKHLKIKELPFGEEKAAKDVSDDYNNVKESIYNPKAARERKVSIIGVFID